MYFCVNHNIKYTQSLCPRQIKTLFILGWLLSTEICRVVKVHKWFGFIFALVDTCRCNNYLKYISLIFTYIRFLWSVTIEVFVIHKLQHCRILLVSVKYCHVKDNQCYLIVSLGTIWTPFMIEIWLELKQYVSELCSN